MKICLRVARRLLLFTFMFAWLSAVAYSQQEGSCAEKLRMAQTLFEKGQVEQVPALLSNCLKSGFSREESLSAYKLIIQSYLFEDDKEKADSAMLEFLKKNPEYQLSPTDHSRFVYQYNNFNVKPVVKFSVHIGMNIPYVFVLKSESVIAESSKSDYRSDILNLFGSLEAKFQIRKKLEINAELGYSKLSFTNIRDFGDIGKTTYRENQQRIEIPLSLTYDFMSLKKLTLYGRAGFGVAISMGATATPDLKPNDINGTPRSGSDIDRKVSRVAQDFFAQAGAGAKYKTRGGYLFGEIRTNIGIYNQVIRSGARPEEMDLENFYYYRDDDFRLNALNFNIGYTMIIYKPSKK